MMRIGINCGHTLDGQPGSGAIGYISESEETREVGKRVIKLLRERGVEVVDCTDDYATSTQDNLSAICTMANAQPLDLFVSIHFNSGGGHGAEVYTKCGRYMKYADKVLQNLQQLGFTNRGIKDRSLYVINHTGAPSMLIEVCFVDSKEDTDRYYKLGADIIAQAICNGIIGNTEELTMTQYEELKNEISELKPMIYNYVDDNMPEWAKPTVQKLMDKGVLVGNENGELGLTMDMLRMLVLLDRVGAFII